MLTIAVYRSIFFVAIGIWLFPEIIGTFTQNRVADGTQRDRGSYIVVHLTRYFAIGLGTVLALQNNAPIFSAQVWIGYWLGILLMVGGVAFRWYAIRCLGRYFTRVVMTQPDQQVVKTGPYRWIRHPSYTGVLLILLGYGLVLNDWLGLLVLLTISFAGFCYRVRVEERALVEALGQSYVTYMGQTRRFIPFVL